MWYLMRAMRCSEIVFAGRLPPLPLPPLGPLAERGVVLVNARAVVAWWVVVDLGRVLERREVEVEGVKRVLVVRRRVLVVVVLVEMVMGERLRERRRERRVGGGILAVVDGGLG